MYIDVEKFKYACTRCPIRWSMCDIENMIDWCVSFFYIRELEIKINSFVCEQFCPTCGKAISVTAKHAWMYCEGCGKISYVDEELIDPDREKYILRLTATDAEPVGFMNGRPMISSGIPVLSFGF